ncbi:head to tail connecting protein [Caudoviricetes sp.]|nr:MAG: head to tail connecting protein [Podoviridae sp. ct2cs2]UOF77521.1 head to tail connecting protein [Caudoviricetes sp.]
MDINKLKSIIESEIDDSIGYVETDTVAERQQALEYYLREPYGNEVEGKSQIVTGEVAEVVDGALPQLIRVFTSTDGVVEFQPVNDGDEPFAEQATEYCNWVFYRDNDGFLILHNWFKDALLQKTGVVKAYWDEKIDVTKEKYESLSDDDLVMLLQDDELEVVEQETEEEIDEITDPMTGQVFQNVKREHYVKVKRTKKEGRVVVENVPPEEFLISKRARTVQDSPFVAHRRMMTRSELVAMGFKKDVVDSLESGDTLEFSPDRIARYSQGEQPNSMGSQDQSMEVVEVYECYIKVDYNNDGIAELRRIVYASNEILEDDECDYIPFHSLCPIPIPHKFYGQSLADRALDLQLIKSTVLRQMLDNLYLTNNYRVGAVEGQVNLDDLLTSTAGGVVRMKNPNAIVPLTVQPTTSGSFPMLEYLDGVQSRRTGVSDSQNGIDPNILQNVTAAAVSAMSQASAGKLELIARIFAETGVKSLFKGILHLLCKYQDKERLVRINGKFVPFNPREWHDQYNVSINVGLGTGTRQEQLTTMQMILQKQEQIIQQYGLSNPLVNLMQYRNTLAKFINMAGFKDAAQFMNEITPEQNEILSQPQPPKPDPNTEAAKVLAQVEREKAMIKAQTDAAKLELEREQMQLDNARKALELQQQELKQNTELALKQLKIEADAANQAEQTRGANTKSIVEALNTINNMTQGNNNVQ